MRLDEAADPVKFDVHPLAGLIDADRTSSINSLSMRCLSSGVVVAARHTAGRSPASVRIARSSSPESRPLEEIAERELGAARPEGRAEGLRSELAEVCRRREKAAGNMALAEGPAQFQAIAAVFEGLVQEEARLRAGVDEAERATAVPVDLEGEVEATLATSDRLAESVPDADDLAASGELFRAQNARLFLEFKEVKPKRRVVNEVKGGLVTFGTAPAPMALYEGPTGRRALKAGQQGCNTEPSKIVRSLA